MARSVTLMTVFGLINPNKQQRILMKRFNIVLMIGLAGLAQLSQAQSTTGGRSGGSTASTGAGYDRGQRIRTDADDPRSMTTTDKETPSTTIWKPAVKKSARSQTATDTPVKPAQPARRRRSTQR